MNLQNIRFPRQLEAEGISETIRQTLMNHTVLIQRDGELQIPVLTMNEFLKHTLQTVRLRGHVRCGFEAIAEKLESERKGIAISQKDSDTPYGERISRLLLFSNDGADRFYRHIEQLLKTHSPRVLGCLLAVDGVTLGKLITGKERRVKIVMLEHKDSVSTILRSIADPKA